MLIPADIEAEFAMEIVHKNGHIGHIIFNQDLLPYEHEILDYNNNNNNFPIHLNLNIKPFDAVWVQEYGENNWYWASKDFYIEEGWNIPYHLPNEDGKIEVKTKAKSKMKYTTRFIIDVSYDNVDGLYGDEDGSNDCGTVLAMDKLLKQAMDAGTLDIDAGKAISATWICYSTNVEHPTTYIMGGKGLHPKLRKSKGKWNA